MSRPRRLVDEAAWRVRNRLKRNPWVRRLAGKEPITPAAQRLRKGGISVHPGRWIVTDNTARLPVVLIVLIGLGREATDRWVDEVAEQQRLTQRFIPVFVTDSALFKRLRHHDFAFEYVPPRADWEASTLREDWFDFVQRRLIDLEALYQPDAVVPIPSGDAGGASVWASLRSVTTRA